MITTLVIAFKLFFVFGGLYLSVTTYRLNLLVVRIRARAERLPRVNRKLDQILNAEQLEYERAYQLAMYFAGALLAIGAFIPA